MERGFRRCNRSNLQTGAVAKKGVIGGFGRSRRPLCRRRFMGGGGPSDRAVGRVVGGGVRGRSGIEAGGRSRRSTGRSGEWLGVECAVGPAIEAGGRSRRSGRKSERVAGPCGQMPRPRNGEAARQQPNRFGWMSDFRRRNLSFSRNCSRIFATTSAGFPPAASVSAGFLPAAVTAASASAVTVTATVVGSGAAAAAIAGGATPRRRTCRAGRRGG